MRQFTHNHTYRPQLARDVAAEPREIEFEASGPDVALRMAHDLCGARSVDMFEDGRKIANVRLSGHNGFWIVGKD
jgi:hypothetical protein